MDEYKVLEKLEKIKGFNTPVILLKDEKSDLVNNDRFKDVILKDYTTNKIKNVIDKNIS